MNVNLVIFGKNSSRKIFALPSSVTVIGRQRGCDLRIPLMSVSKKHCQLNIDNGNLKLRDLGSRNGTYLDGKRIEEAVVQAGNSVRIGPLTFVIQIDGKPETITPPKKSPQNQPKQDTPKKGITDEQFSSFAEMDEFDLSTEDAKEQPESLTDFDDFDLSEETDSK